MPADSPWANPWAAGLLVVAMIYGFSAVAWQFFELPWMKPKSRKPDPERQTCQTR
jgi:hypothetical protein